MTKLKNASVLCGALLAAVCVAPQVWAQANLRDRVAAAVEKVESGCAADIAKFCGNVTRGEGRLITCMQTFDDQLSRSCQFVLWRASRNLNRATNRVERLADACWTDIEKQCGGADQIGKCLVDKRDQLSRACRTVVSKVRQTLQQVVMQLKGLPVFSADGQNLGEVVDVIRGPDGKVESAKIQVGRFLGMGDRVVTISATNFEQLRDRIKLRLTGDGVRNLPEEKKQ